jgi:hypothetical protein
VNRFGESLGLLQIGFRGLTPEHVGIRRVSKAAGDRLVQAGIGLEESLCGSFAGDERMVPLIHV